MQLEFLDEPAPEGVADARRDDRWPRWLGGAVIAVVLGLAAFVVASRHDQPPRPAPPRPVAVPSPRPVFSPLPSVLAGKDETFSAVYQRATDSAVAADIARSGSNPNSCRQVRIGTSPQRRAGRALVAALPGFRVLDSARIIDQNAGLCGLQVRARAADGTVAVIIVSSPNVGLGPLNRDQELDTDSLAVGSTLIEYARFLAHDGWKIIVGTTGPAGKPPAGAALERLALDPALRW